MHADFLDDVSTGLGDDWVEGAGSASGGEGDDTLRQISRLRAGRLRRRPHRRAPADLIDGGSGFDRSWSTTRRSPPAGGRAGRHRRGINGSTADLRHRGVRRHRVRRGMGGRRRQPVLQRPGELPRPGRRRHLPGRTGRGRGRPRSRQRHGRPRPRLRPRPGRRRRRLDRGSRRVRRRGGVRPRQRHGHRRPRRRAQRLRERRLPAPETSRIDGPKKVTKGTKAFFTFAASVASATFECQVDAGAFKACSSPFKVKTKKLKTGSTP